MSRPTCTVRGVPARGGVCSRVIVGGQECGEPSGSCHYQGPPLARPQAATDAALAARLFAGCARPVELVAFTAAQIRELTGVRRCIACGASVPSGKSEACPHA